MLLFLPAMDYGVEWKLNQMAVTADSHLAASTKANFSNTLCTPPPTLVMTVEHPRVSECFTVTAGLGQCLMKVTYQTHS